MGISMEAQKEAILEKSKKTMSVPEMRRLLGLKKTDSYWLVHRNFFQTYIVNGQMRVDIASFEKWYANQVKHKKVNGAEPGAELMKSSYSFRDAANLLGIHSSNLYEIWRDQNLKTITVDFTKRIPIEVFEEWYEHHVSESRQDAYDHGSGKRLYPFAGGSSPRRGYQRNNHQMDSDGAFFKCRGRKGPENTSE